MKSLKQFLFESVQEVNGFVMLKPEFLDKSEEWCKMLQNNGWQIIQKKEFIMPNDMANELYIMHKNKPFYKDLCKYITSDKCLCALCHKDCDNPIEDMKTLKDKVRKAWGKDEMKNAMHSSDSLENVKREKNLVFNNI